MTIILGPAVCQVCRQHVYLNEHRRWCDEDHRVHRCPRFLEDPELGRLRLCRRCSEFWPDDDDFWTLNGKGRKVCKACQREWARRYYERQRAAA